jgi:processing peptidase subunit alpha
MHEFCAQFAKLSITPVDPTELSRARNMLKCNVLTQLESRIVMFEDVARQLVTYGRRESPESLCQKIESVTAIDIMRYARRRAAASAGGETGMGFDSIG